MPRKASAVTVAEAAISPPPPRGRKRTAPASTEVPPSKRSRRTTLKESYKEESDVDVPSEKEIGTVKVKAKKAQKKSEIPGAVKSEEVDEDISNTKSAQTKTRANKPAKKSTKSKKEAPAASPQPSEAEQRPVKAKVKRKTAEVKALEAMPLAARSLTSKLPLFLGAHISAAGGVQNSVTNAVYIGANAFALFLKSQRKWENPALKSEHQESFAEIVKKEQYDPSLHVLPHGSYLVNLASADDTMVAKAYPSFVDDLRRCQTLGIGLYNFHPGNTNGAPRSEAIARLAKRLNAAHAETSDPSPVNGSRVVTLLENMAASPSGNTLGGKFEDLRDTIELVTDKSRVGVCLDTCHLFAAGFDLRSREAYAATMDSFDTIVGRKYLRALHINDSKGMFGSHRDLHQNIGLGFLGLRAFWNVVNDERLRGLPLILETPCDVKGVDGKTTEDKGTWAREIKMLESLVGMDPEGDEFREMETRLAHEGAAEREKLRLQYEKKEQSPKKKKGTKVNIETSDDEA